VEVIPNSLETDLFIPRPKKTAKAKLGIKADTLTLLFGADQETRNEKASRNLKKL